MTEHKFTDAEVISGLEHCSVYDGKCNGCPYDSFECLHALPKDALTLINRQKAEIERLQKHNLVVARKHYNDGVADFADRLESNIESGLLYEGTLLFRMISKTVKEMTEEKT